MLKSVRFGLVLTHREKIAIERLAEVEGGLSQAALVCRLIRKAAHDCGLWPPPNSDNGQVQRQVQEAGHA